MRILYMTTVPLLLALVAPALAAEPALVLEDTPPAIGGIREPVYSGPLADIGKSLRDNGIDLRLDYVNIYQNAPSFGFEGGSSANYGMFIFGATGHLSPDLRINFTETINYPTYNVENYLFDLSNAFFPVPVVDSRTDLTRLTLEADFFDDRFQIEAGRMGPARDFMTKGFCGGLGCLNSTQAISLNIPGESLSVWGARAAYKLTPITTLGFGIIEDNPDNWQSGNGWDWQSGNSEGYIAIANLRHDETFVESTNPLKFEIGAYHRSAPYEDALYNDGWGNPTFGPAPTILTHESGTSGIYAQARKVIWSNPSGGIIPENLAVYGGIFHTFGEGQAYPWEAYAGLEYSGFWAENPLATIGASVRYIGLSDERAQYERNARLFISGIDEAQPKDTFMFDLHGTTGIFGNGILDVGAAYLVNPNTSVLADFSTSRQKDGFVFYAALAFDLSGGLGLSPRRGP
ncbi:carbohydrate porin [Agrobacterium tumefaciens]|uniref:carbohydrate porin n=1 Tax=Agrobacterium tumefaciens TaxID=358 RepID=UPI001572CB71|nr:carbohydrate porin [Agrobacterium tumefaciens]